MTTISVGPVPASRRSAVLDLLHHPSVTYSLIAGLLMLLAVVALAVIGPMFVDARQGLRTGDWPARLAPSGAHLLGTDSLGRDLWTYMILGLPNTLKIGFLAASVGTAIGLTLALISGFFGGWVDRVIRIVSDSLLTVPALAILLIVAANVEKMSVEAMALTLAAVSWMFPTRVIRSQVLSIRERAYVEVARANGVGPLGLLFREVLPNLMPFVATATAGAVAVAILGAIGLEALGLGVLETPSLGMTIYWSQHYSAVIRGLWWWWAPPIVAISFIFVSLFLIATGLDRVANPRLRRGS